MAENLLDQITEITQVGAKHWSAFETVSPGGIPFAGYLCRQESDKFGMLAVTEQAGAPRLEFIYAMPKIDYPYIPQQDGSLRVVIDVPPGTVDARFTHKLDGTAIIFYPLTGPDGEILEVIPRTRLQPVLTPSRWGDWNALLAAALPDRSGVEAAVRTERAVLIFELWGNRNAHLIRYDEPLRLTLHTARHLDGRLYPFPDVMALAEKYGLEVVKSVAVLTPDAAGLVAAYAQVQAEMEARNQAAGEEVFVDEGVILALSTAQTAVYLKCKPPSIEEIHWQADQHVSKAHIEQALFKLAENNYDFDTGQVADLYEKLESDFDREELEANADLIERIFHDFRAEMRKQATLRDLLRTLIAQENLDPTDLPGLMRHLSKHYARSEMSWVFGVVKSLGGR